MIFRRIAVALKKYPLVYSIIERIYYCVHPKRFKEFFFGSSLNEKFWKERHNTEGKKWIVQTLEGANIPHRKKLLSIIEKEKPESIFEFGCGPAPNLYLFSKSLTKAKFKGIDINAETIKYGMNYFKEKKINNIELISGSLKELKEISTNSFDIVLTDAVLIYLGPDKISEIIKELVRIAKKKILFVEWTFFDNKKDPKRATGLRYKGLWKRDYIALVKKYTTIKEAKTIKITKLLWDDKTWKSVGAIIDISIKND